MEKMASDNTTIKISKKTKNRIDTLREYKRETYEEILEKILDVLNLCKVSPMRARAKLMKIDNKHKETRANKED